MAGASNVQDASAANSVGSGATAKADDRSLEYLLSRSVDPYLSELERTSFVHLFCDRVNEELEGPQIAARLLAHRIQSPHDQEAINALVVLDTSVQNCGPRFHSEIGKFKFLNEMIKILSPKYLGGQTKDRVKQRVIELLYTWKCTMRHLTKVAEAYSNLKTQGIVKDDPSYLNQQIYETSVVEAPAPRLATFEDEDKSKLLDALLRSGKNDDLIAANRLIKSMVKAEDQRIEKSHKRNTDLQCAEENARLLSDIVNQFDASCANGQDIQLMKELASSLVDLRRTLFKYASDAPEGDENTLASILMVNDEVNVVIEDYKRKVEPHLHRFVHSINQLAPSEHNKQQTTQAKDMLALLNFDAVCPDPLTMFGGNSNTQHTATLQNDDAQLIGGPSSTETPPSYESTVTSPNTSQPATCTGNVDQFQQLFTNHKTQQNSVTNPGQMPNKIREDRLPNSLDLLSESLIEKHLPRGVVPQSELRKQRTQTPLSELQSTKAITTEMGNVHLQNAEQSNQLSNQLITNETSLIDSDDVMQLKLTGGSLAVC